MKRIFQIDTLRGLMLVSMGVNHMLRQPAFASLSYLQEYTYEPLGFFSAAEGFFFLSGLIAGIVYGKPILQGKFRLSRSRALKRAKEIYVVNMVAFLLMAISSVIYTSYLSAGQDFSADPLLLLANPYLAFVFGAIFMYLPTPLDILPLYCLFVLMIPVVLSQLRDGRVKLVIAVSIALWVLGQIQPVRLLNEMLTSIHPSIVLGWFDVFACQILFVLGLVFGYSRLRDRLPKFLRNPCWQITVSVLAFSALLFVMRHNMIGIDVPEHLTAKSYLAPIRLLNFALVAFIMTQLARKYSAWFNVRWLQFLGGHSLYIFLYHMLFLHCFKIFKGYVIPLGPEIKVTIIIVYVASLFIPAYMHQKARGYRLKMMEKTAA